LTTRTKTNTVQEVAEFLKNLDRVAITTHVGADGDAIGASAALLRLMRYLGAAAVFCHAEATSGGCCRRRSFASCPRATSCS
jgi:phosphoesterase RecJ-like protein